MSMSFNPLYGSCILYVLLIPVCTFKIIMFYMALNNQFTLRILQDEKQIREYRDTTAHMREQIAELQSK